MSRSWTASTANDPWIKTYTGSAYGIHYCAFSDSPFYMPCSARARALKLNNAQAVVNSLTFRLESTT